MEEPIHAMSLPLSFFIILINWPVQESWATLANGIKAQYIAEDGSSRILRIGSSDTSIIYFLINYFTTDLQ